MVELVREWPRSLERALSEIRAVSGRSGCYIAEVDLSEDEVRTLNLFEASARHEHVSFRDPETAQACFAYLNTPVGLGGPRAPGAGIARVRISFTDVQRVRPAEAHETY
ncbi:hypothetical protein [Microvirga pudoricolor]|uniref:hypothetical protein n=1 Tax=Microvirga pudoricolor TaxID=2778729 RepID=UPI00194DDE45|nr:hypothetical protein [Microvirga pudoricolor]MBM6596463.1 hypothetical protein [Microvirga pudoricolor]